MSMRREDADVKKKGETISVRIGNMTYQLNADTDEQFIRETASLADDMVRRISDQYPGINTLTTAVLALVNAIGTMRAAIDDKKASLEALDNERMQKEAIKAELARLGEQCWELKKDLLYYRNLCEIYEQKLASIDEEAGGRQKARPAKRPPLTVAERQTSFDDVIKMRSDDA